MKLRIRGDSIRLRLTQPEVATLAARGAVEERTRFPDGKELVYRVEASDSARSVDVRCTEYSITVLLPRADAASWPTDAQVGFEHALALPGRGSLRVLIEKDFECLDHPTETEEGAYPHPNKGGACGPAT